jgi:hypothetical protein
MQFWNPEKKDVKRVFLWVAAAGYTVTLPHIIILYDLLSRTFSMDLVRRIPQFTILTLGILYIAYGFYLKRGVRPFVSFGFCALFAYGIIHFESVQVTHFHIPEYVLLSWIIFYALSLDYSGSGIFFLTFVCTALLGVVEELLQGLHPDRFFLVEDMAINAASAIIGVFSIMGIKPEAKPPSRNGWIWIAHLKHKKYPMFLILSGGLGAGIMIYYLLNLRTAQAMWRIYPRWLLSWSLGFIFMGAFYILNPKQRTYRTYETSEDPDGAFTAQLWMLCPLIILIWMHMLTFFIILPGWRFE